jgi:hypothetical protein
MKNITRLALGFAVATIACLAPMAHAEDEAPLIGSGIQPVRYYRYFDKEGEGTMVVKDGSKSNGGRRIYVTIEQKDHTFYGKGWRSLTSEEDNWLADCEFWVYVGGGKAKFQGVIPIKYDPDFNEGGGYYYLNGSGTYLTGSPYEWKCEFGG